jgi:hypothetical protein
VRRQPVDRLLRLEPLGRPRQGELLGPLDLVDVRAAADPQQVAGGQDPIVEHPPDQDAEFVEPAAVPLPLGPWLRDGAEEWPGRAERAAVRAFRIVKLQDGTGPPVVLASGLTEGGTDWGGWKDMVQDRYPDAPVYRVHWGAKELKLLSGLVATGAGKAVLVSPYGKPPVVRVARRPGGSCQGRPC